jgi:predicted nucleotidyltransferase
MTDPLVIIFGGKTKARILDVLLSHPNESYHLRGLAQAAGTDSGNTSKLLKSLVEGGLVTAAPDRHSTRYSINPQSPLVPALRQLVACAGALMVDLRAVADRIDAAYIGVYGSVASGTDDADSDIDVLVVGDLSVVAAQTAFKSVGRKHQKTVNVVVVTAAELPRKLRNGGAFWTSIAEGAKIDLKGAWIDVANSQTIANRSVGVRAVPAGQNGGSRLDRRRTSEGKGRG